MESDKNGRYDLNIEILIACKEEKNSEALKTHNWACLYIVIFSLKVKKELLNFIKYINTALRLTKKYSHKKYWNIYYDGVNLGLALAWSSQCEWSQISNEWKLMADV